MGLHKYKVFKIKAGGTNKAVYLGKYPVVKDTYYYAIVKKKRLKVQPLYNSTDGTHFLHIYK